MHFTDLSGETGRALMAAGPEFGYGIFTFLVLFLGGVAILIRRSASHDETTETIPADSD